MKNTQDQENFSKILKELILFSVPLILSGILQQLYNWVDAFIVGNVEGELALGAIGGTGSITSFYIMAITGFTIGVAVLAGQKYGSGEMDFINHMLSAFAILLGLVFLLLAVIGISLVPSVLRLIHTPVDTVKKQYENSLILVQKHDIISKDRKRT